MHGIIPPLITPLRDANELDEIGLEQLIERVVDGGANALFLLGTTGESPSLTMDLKEQFTRLACKLGAPHVPVLVNVTSTAVGEVMTLANCAAECGATALVLAPPFYFNLTQDELLGYFERVIPALPLPVYLYNYPQVFKTPIALETLEAVRNVPFVLGLKDSSGDLNYLSSVRRLFPKDSGFGLYCGPEELLTQALDIGVDGGVSGGANLYPRLYADLYQAHQSGDHALLQSLHELVMEVSRNIYGVSGGYAGTIRGIKCALAALGISTGITAEPLGPLPYEVNLCISQSARTLEERLAALSQ